jgi:hypothetical protein
MVERRIAIALDLQDAGAECGRSPSGYHVRAHIFGCYMAPDFYISAGTSKNLITYGKTTRCHPSFDKIIDCFCQIDEEIF